MSAEIKKRRGEKAKHDLAIMLYVCLLLLSVTLLLYTVLTVIPHVGSSIETITLTRWEQGRDDTLAFLLGAIGTISIGFFLWWRIEDEKLAKEQEKEAMRETVKQVLEENKAKTEG